MKHLAVGICGSALAMTAGLIFLLALVFGLYGVVALVLGEFHGREIGLVYLAVAAPVAWLSYGGTRSGWSMLKNAIDAARKGAPPDGPRFVRRR